MSRTSGTKHVQSGGSQTIQGAGGVTVISTGGNVTISAPGGNVEVLQGNNTGSFVVVSTHNAGNNVSGPAGQRGDDNPTGDPHWPDDGTYFNTQAERKEAGAYFSGGVGIEKDLSVGGIIYGRVSNANTATTSTQLSINTSDNNQPYYLLFAQEAPTNGIVYEDISSPFQSFIGGQYDSGSRGLVYYPNTGENRGGELSVDRISIVADETSTSTNTGALQVKGGASIVKDVTIGGTIYPANNFADSYLDDVYTNFLGLPASTGTITLGAGLTDIFGDIRARGKNPIGTAPVVTNVLYVTMDGDDTNDGRAQDAGRACRTISGAVKSLYYQPGTQIRVAPGHYLEDNPIPLKPYTSVMGSDLRTTSVEPINKTQDLWHMNSGCYLAFMQFLNGRSGLLDGPYAPGFNRGSYATAFPPLPEGQRIDLFHSPYIQNCTNLSGPWLKDGTMFVPDQTVQVPVAVGMGSWPANVTTLTVVVSTGTIVQGMSVNAGQQNPGFFNARTLLLANKQFLQEQTIDWITDQINTYGSDPTSIWYNFSYSTEKCYRDVGILVENTAYDAAFGGNEKSVESGLAYYNGVVSVIAGQEAQTTAAIEYIRDRSLEIIQNTMATNTYTGGVAQVINTALVGGDVSTASIINLYGIITATITNPDNAPDVYKSTGPDAAFVSAEILLQANRTFIQENTLNYINWNLCYPPKQLPYNQIKCRRDLGVIIDSVSSDLLFPTVGYSQSTFAGSQYYNQGNYTGQIGSEITTTTNAVNYLKELAVKVIQNITPANDLVPRYQSVVPQVTNLEAATSNEVGIVNSEFAIILNILGGDTEGWTDKIIPNGTASNLVSVKNAYALLEANKSYMQAEVIAYISATAPGFTYNTATCERDVGYMVDSVAFDLLYGGNRQAIQSGLSYYTLNGSSIVIPGEESPTVNSFNHLRDLIGTLITGGTPTTIQNKVPPVLGLPSATSAEQTIIATAISTITNIIANGPTGISLTPISLSASANANVSNAYNIIQANRDFLTAEVIAWIDETYNSGSFIYDQDLYYRDTGLLVDAVSQDILLGGNQKSIEAALSYWNKGYNYVANQATTTTAAISYIKEMAQYIINNQTTATVTGTYATQIINPFFSIPPNKAYMPTEAVNRNFETIKNIVANGPNAAPAVYAGGGLFALTGINGADVKLAPKVTSVQPGFDQNTFVIGLDQPTVGFGTNATLYFGNVGVYPMLDDDVDAVSFQYTGNTSTWAIRKLDPIGAMGGSLVDGAVVSDRSPIQSFVYDAFTQLSQGGRGIHITNSGYAQLVSVFTIFCSTAVQVDNGGIASITNSNNNFGDLCLVAKGYGARSFSGTVVNPVNRAYPFSPGQDGLDQYYPSGFWPNGGTVEIFVPDTADRPHIALVMEVIPPEDHLNEQTLPGFLNAQPSTGTLTTSTIVLVDIDTTDVAIGNSVFIRDQYGRQYDDNGMWYAATGTVVTDVNYNSITLNQALTGGGGDPTNPNYFTLYFCGNSYYTVLSSTIANNPYKVGTNILDLNTDPNYQGPTTPGQIAAHDASIGYLNTLVDQIIDNQTVSTLQTDIPQVKLPLVTGGSGAQPFIDLRFTIIRNILTATDIDSAESVVPPSAVTKTGTIVSGAGSAVTLITANFDFLAAEVFAYVQANQSQVFNGLTQTQIDYIQNKCNRDVKLILQRLIYDLETGGTYNSVYSGLSYWSRLGTYHIVELGEAVTRTDLFPDGANVNFYQRSYISASGYLFEYVGAGTNYGSLPQVGRADPVQSKETVQLNSGKVFFTSTDQNGDFRIGRGLVISQATGVLSGRTFTQSLFANMTPFILAIEGTS